MGRRPAVASLVLLPTFLICLWIGTYTEAVATGGGANPRLPQLGPAMLHVTPGWAIPAAVAVGVAGAALAGLTYRATKH